ncbi:glutamine synthetase [Romboutsia sp.]|uniref:glutamine synthetase n=1 Tax=Romboutsia sp. TaxID=1965302 RepID=UPI003F406B4A
MKELLYVVKPNNLNESEIAKILLENKNIKFVSLMGVDIGGNATDEKIPVEIFLDDPKNFLKNGIQTDGSSVELNEIATLNDAKVDLLPDSNVNWYIDYNYDYIDESTGLPVGTLKMPAFLFHNGEKVCSRGILEKAVNNFRKSITELFKEYPHMINNIGINSVEDIENIMLTAATELELWVKTPEDKADYEKLYVSQSLKEQYWKRTHGVIRTALEKTLRVLQMMGVEPEMGHKEVGGINSSVSIDGNIKHAMEQLEIDWKFSNPIQAADNELIIREVVEDIFALHGLKVNFKAKPLYGVAGNGEHTHVGVSVKLADGSIQNLFSPKVMDKDYMSEIGYGALMGVLRNYEVLNPIVTSSNDAFNRLVPGFEAPVCIVTSLGHSYNTPSRNRSILIGLIRDMNNPLATRFELRAPNPLSNTYLVLAGLYQVMLHGITAVAKSKLTIKELEKELSKDVGEDGLYLDKNRAYRDENDVFEHYTEEERNKRYSTPPATVYENIKNLELYSHKLESLSQGDVFMEKIINSFKVGILERWCKELTYRIIENNTEIIRECKKNHTPDNMDALDELHWNNIESLKKYLMKNTMTKKALFAQIKEALENEDYETASNLQLEMNAKMKEIQDRYIHYKKNLY